MENKIDENLIKNLTKDSKNSQIKANILDLLLSISMGEMDRYALPHQIKHIDSLLLPRELEKELSEIYAELPFKLDASSLNGLSNSQIKGIIDEYEMILSRKIQRYLHIFNKECVLITLLHFSSILSNLTFSAYEDIDLVTELDIFNKSELECISMLWRILNKRGMDIRALIGEMKGSVEVAINDLLQSNITFSDNVDYIPDIKKILILYYSKVYLWQLRQVIPVLFDKRSELFINDEIGIGIPKFISESFSAYQSDTQRIAQRVENRMSEIVYSRFEEFYGFQPRTIFEYLSLGDSSRAHKLEGITVSLSPKDLLIEDIKLSKNLTQHAAEEAVAMFVLNNKSFYESNPSDHFGSSSNRLFRTPLIELDNYYLVPTFTFVESAFYLPKRILTREAGTEGQYEKFVKLNEYDEYDLPLIVEFLNGWNIGSIINFNLSQIELLKKDLEELKGITKELDLLYIFKGDLFIWDLKNWGFEFNLYDVKKDVKNILNYKKKQKKTREFVLSKKKIISENLGITFNDVHMGILTVHPTIYNYIDNLRDDSVKSVSEFYNMKFI